MQPTPEVVRSLVVTHCVARLAAAQLHSPWVNETIKSSAKCLSACKAIIAAVGVMPQESLRCVDPFLIVSPFFLFECCHQLTIAFVQVLLTFAAHMIIGELVHRAKGTSLYQGPYPLTSCVNPVYLTRALDEAVTLIGAMNRGSKFTGTSFGTPSDPFERICGVGMLIWTFYRDAIGSNTEVEGCCTCEWSGAYTIGRR